MSTELTREERLELALLRIRGAAKYVRVTSPKYGTDDQLETLLQLIQKECDECFPPFNSTKA